MSYTLTHNTESLTRTSWRFILFYAFYRIYSTLWFVSLYIYLLCAYMLSVLQTSNAYVTKRNVVNESTHILLLALQLNHYRQESRAPKPNTQFLFQPLLLTWLPTLNSRNQLRFIDRGWQSVAPIVMNSEKRGKHLELHQSIKYGSNMIENTHL